MRKNINIQTHKGVSHFYHSNLLNFYIDCLRFPHGLGIETRDILLRIMCDLFVNIQNVTIILAHGPKISRKC